MCSNHLSKEQAEEQIEKILNYIEDLDSFVHGTKQEALLRSMFVELIKLRDGYINVH